MPGRLPVAAVVVLVMGWHCSSSFEADLRQYSQSGRDLDAVEAEKLETQLVEDPEDLIARSQLLGFYDRQFRDDSARARRHQHVLWLIENAPEANVLAGGAAGIDHVLYADAYRQGSDAWTAHLQSDPNNLSLLRHAAEFYTLGDRPTAIRLLQRAQSIDDSNPLWAKRLGHLHSLDMQGRGESPASVSAALDAFAQFERAYDLSFEAERDQLLEELAKTALAAGDVEKAREYAESMLDRSGGGWLGGIFVHHGNLTLGRIALAEGDVAEAKRRLIMAGGTTGAPTLNSFGPNMALAEELLEIGESEIVLEYFDLCSKFWNTAYAEEDLSRWSRQVAAGDIPDFCANLTY